MSRPDFHAQTPQSVAKEQTAGAPGGSNSVNATDAAASVGSLNTDTPAGAVPSSGTGALRERPESARMGSTQVQFRPGASSLAGTEREVRQDDGRDERDAGAGERGELRSRPDVDTQARTDLSAALQTPPPSADQAASGEQDPMERHPATQAQPAAAVPDRVDANALPQHDRGYTAEADEASEVVAYAGEATEEVLIHPVGGGQEALSAEPQAVAAPLTLDATAVFLAPEAEQTAVVAPSQSFAAARSASPESARAKVDVASLAVSEPQHATEAVNGISPLHDKRTVRNRWLTTNFGKRIQTAKDAALEQSWDGDPKEIIDGMVAEMRDTLSPVPANELDTNGRNKPVPLEHYLLSRIQHVPEISGHKPNGGLDAEQSIKCIRDEVRTRKFLMGIDEAVTRLDSQVTDTIEVCEAGCGALPILSIKAALSSDKVRVTALEFNPDSAKIAREVVSALGLQDRITVVQADATNYEPPAPLDLLISETMDTGLSYEPIVQIMSHLKPFVKPDGITLPDGVNVKAALVPMSAFTNNSTLLIGDMPYSVVTPDWHNVTHYQPGDDLPFIQFGLSVEEGDFFLAVISEVSIGSQALGMWESQITSPHYLRDSDGKNITFSFDGSDTGRSIVVRYAPGDNLNDKVVGLTRRRPAVESSADAYEQANPAEVVNGAEAFTPGVTPPGTPGRETLEGADEPPRNAVVEMVLEAIRNSDDRSFEELNATKEEADAKFTEALYRTVKQARVKKERVGRDGAQFLTQAVEGFPDIVFKRFHAAGPYMPIMDDRTIDEYWQYLTQEHKFIESRFGRRFVPYTEFLVVDGTNFGDPSPANFSVLPDREYVMVQDISKGKEMYNFSKNKPIDLSHIAPELKAEAIAFITIYEKMMHEDRVILDEQIMVNETTGKIKIVDTNTLISFNTYLEDAKRFYQTFFNTFDIDVQSIQTPDDIVRILIEKIPPLASLRNATNAEIMQAADSPLWIQAHQYLEEQYPGANFIPGAFARLTDMLREFAPTGAHNQTVQGMMKQFGITEVELAAAQLINLKTEVAGHTEQAKVVPEAARGVETVQEEKVLSANEVAQMAFVSFRLSQGRIDFQGDLDLYLHLAHSDWRIRNVDEITALLTKRITQMFFPGRSIDAVDGEKIATTGMHTHTTIQKESDGTPSPLRKRDIERTARDEVERMQLLFNPDVDPGFHAGHPTKEQLIPYILDGFIERDSSFLLHKFLHKSSGRERTTGHTATIATDPWSSFVVEYILRGNRTNVQAFDEMCVELKDYIMQQEENSTDEWRINHRQLKKIIRAYNKHHGPDQKYEDPFFTRENRLGRLGEIFQRETEQKDVSNLLEEQQIISLDTAEQQLATRKRIEARQIVPDLAVDDMQDVVATRLVTQEELLTYLNESCEVVRLGNTDVVFASIEHAHNPELPLPLVALAEADNTNLIMLEYYEPEVKKNISKIPFIGKKMVRNIDNGKSKFAVEFKTGVSNELVDIAREREIPITVADIANGPKYSAAYSGLPLAEISLGEISTFVHALPASAAFTFLTGMWFFNRFQEFGTKTGLFDKNKIHKYEKVLFDTEDARRVLLVDVIQKLAVANDSTGEDRTRILVPYPQAHAKRIAHYLQAETKSDRAALAVKRVLYRHIPGLDKSLRTYSGEEDLV